MESMKKWISERTTKKNGLYVHYSPPKLLDVVSAAQFRQWARDGAGTKLERAVLAGQGRRLLAEAEALPLSHHLPALVAKCDALHAAVEKGSLLELQELLEVDYNRRKFVTCRDEAGVGLLHKAVYYEYFDIANWLVSNYPHLVNERDSAGRTPLHYAVACRDEARMAALLEGAGAARGARDAAGRTPAHYRAARTLLTLPTPPDMPPEQTRNPPGLVIKRHNIRIWFHDCDMARLQRVVWDGHGARLLGEVSNQPVVKRFLEALPYIMNTIREIHNAVAQNDLEGLIKHAGEPVPAQILSSRDPNNLTVMHKAAGLGEGGIIRYITERYPQGINDVDNDGRTPLHYAATVRDDQHMYNTLVSLGADAGVVDNKNRTPAYYINRPQEIDKNIFKVLPEAPRTPTSAYPANWDWKILDTEAVVELNKKSRRKNLKASNENISSKNNSNSISENTHSRRGGMKTSSTHDMIKSLPDLNESSKNHNGNVEVNKDSEVVEDTDAKNDTEAEKDDNEVQEVENEEQSDVKEENQDESKEPVEETTDHPEVSESTENVDEFHNEEEYKDIVEENISNHGDGTNDGDVTNDNEEEETIDNSEEENENKQISDTEENSQKEDVHDNKESNIEENNKEEDIQATNENEAENEDITNQSDHDQDENIDKCQDEDNEIVNHEEESGKEEIKGKHDENTSHDNDSNKSEEEGDPPIEGNNNHNEDDDDVQVQGDITHSEYSDTHHQNTAEVIDTTSAKRGSEIDGRNTQESLIEGIINSEAEQDSQDASITQRDDTVHGEILVIDSEIDPEVTELINTANMEMLATLVLNGEGSRLVGRRSGNVELQAFLDNVPTYMQKINRVHLAAREGNIRDLQSALDRRKFAIARDPISPNGATPLHVAAVFGKTNIMKYLGGRFPETLSAVDFEGRTALHYAAVLPDNGHYYNLLQQLGANSKDLDDNGRSAEDYNKDHSLLPFSQLIADYGISEEAAQDMLSDKGSSNADGHMDIPAFKTDEGRYLAKSLGDPLIKGLTEVANVKPKDPVAFLASFLHNFPEHEKPQLGTQESNTIVTKEKAEVENDLPPPAELVPQPLQVSKLTRSAARTATRPQKPIDVVTVDPQPEASSDGPESAFSSANRDLLTDLLPPQDEHGQSMLHFAAARHHTNNAVFQLIQESDISIAYRDELYRTARDVSIQANVPENTMDIDKWVLHLAARGNTEKIMQLLLEGYDHIIDLVDEDGVTIADIVVQRGDTQMSNLLASIPAFEDSREALLGAVRRGDLAAVEESISAEGGRTLARSQNSFGRTALHVAVLAQHEDIVAYLVQTCPELLRIGDNLERTPLHYAMGVEKMESLSRLLIRAGAKRVLKDLKGRQPSYYFMNKSDVLRLKEEEEVY